MRVSGALLISIATAVWLTSCSSQESARVKPSDVQQPFVSQPNPQPSTAAKPKPQSPVTEVTKPQQPAAAIQKRQPQLSPLRKKVISLLEKKSYRQAIELMSGKNREGMEREYVLAINGLLEVGDDAFSLGDYAAAARSFKGVLDAYPVEPSLKERISYTPKQIRAYLETCANRLMDQGLEEYRRGKLENAISKWKGVLMINPAHQEARKSLDTATVQLQALQKLKKK